MIILCHLKRSIERQFQKSGLALHKEALRAKSIEYHKALSNTKKTTTKQEIGKSYQRYIFQVIERLIVHCPTQLLLSHSSTQDLSRKLPLSFIMLYTNSVSCLINLIINNKFQFSEVNVSYHSV